MRFRTEAIADSIMLQVDEMLTKLPPKQREQVIRVLDGVSRVRLNTKTANSAI